MVITPFRSFVAFQDHPTPKLTGIRFSFDSKFVCATGNQRQLKVWSAMTDAAHAAVTPSARAPSAGSRSGVAPAEGADTPAATTAPKSTIPANMIEEAAAVDSVIEATVAAELAAKAAEDNMVAAPVIAVSATASLTEPVAEFLMDQPSTCMDWTPNPTDDGAELIVGDSVGRLRALRLKH